MVRNLPDHPAELAQDLGASTSEESQMGAPGLALKPHEAPPRAQPRGGGLTGELSPTPPGATPGLRVGLGWSVIYAAMLVNPHYSI